MLLQILFSLLVVYFSRQLWLRWKYDIHKMPTPPGLPFLGQTLAFLKGSGEAELSYLRGRWWRELGRPKLLKAHILGRTIVYVTDMEYARSVVFSKTNPLPRPQLATSIVVLSTGNDAQAKSLSTVHKVTPYVKAARKIYANAFQSSSLKAAFPKLMGVLERMVAVIDDEREAGPIDFQELCVKMTLDTIGRVALDSNLGGLDGSREIHKLLLESNLIGFQRLFNFWTALCCKYFPNTQRVQQQEATIRRLTAEWDKLTAEILKRDDPPRGENPIWHGFKSLVDPETGKSLPYESLRAEIAGIVLAGMDTTGHQLAWILSMLTSHPRVVEKLLEEMEEHGLYGPQSRDVQFDDLAELKYLNAVIKEGMRIASTNTGTFPRSVGRDTEIMGYRVPKGTGVLVTSSRWLGSESDWGDPEVVRPERWLGDEDMTKKHYLGFSFGPRDCVGQKLAILEMRASIVYLLRRYELKPVIPFFDLMKNCRNGVTIQAVDGICFRVTKRA